MNTTRFSTGRAALVLAAAITVTVGGWLAGCGNPRKAEPLVGEKQPPTAEVQRGKVTFMRYCNQCHPGGSGGLGPALNNKPLPGAAIKVQVRLGGGAMPAFKKDRISDDELADMVAYMKWLHDLKVVRRS